MIAFRVVPGELHILVKISVATCIFVSGVGAVLACGSVPICLAPITGALFTSSFSLGSAGVAFPEVVGVDFGDADLSFVMMSPVRRWSHDDHSNLKKHQHRDGPVHLFPLAGLGLVHLHSTGFSASAIAFLITPAHQSA
jgi:hypothetical protein